VTGDLGITPRPAGGATPPLDGSQLLVPSPREENRIGQGPTPDYGGLLDELDPAARATPTNIARLRIQAEDRPESEPIGDLRSLATELISALSAGIEAGAKTRWRRKKFRRALQEAAVPIALDAAKRLAAHGQQPTQEQVREAVAAAVAEAIGRVPNAFRKENMLGFGLFAVGLILGGTVNVELMSQIPNSSEAVKFASQNLLSTLMGYMLLMFNPYFNDKTGAQSRALN
jgi:hypothetical protein